MVDIDNFVEVFDTIDGIMSAGRVFGPLEGIAKCRRYDVGNERALATAADSGDCDKATEGDFNIDVFEVVVACPTDTDEIAISFATLGGSMNLASAIEEAAGDTARVGRDFLEGAGGQEFAAAHAWSWPEIDDRIGGPHGVLIVLDNDERVPEISQFF